MQLRPPEGTLVWRACLRGADHYRRHVSREERPTETFSQTRRSCEAHRKNPRRRDPRIGPAGNGGSMSQAPQIVSSSPVLQETRLGSIITLVMNRPDRLNALNNELTTALNEALLRVANDSSINVVVLTGAGRAFCAGGDLGAIGKGRERGDSTELGPILRSGMQPVLNIRTMPQPVIAAVNRSEERRVGKE